jgi:hypothetical protein
VKGKQVPPYSIKSNLGALKTPYVFTDLPVLPNSLKYTISTPPEMRDAQISVNVRVGNVVGNNKKPKRKRLGGIA